MCLSLFAKSMYHVYRVSVYTAGFLIQLVDNETNDAAIVDPVEPDKVLAAVQKRSVNLKAVLTTHHHWDHAGGNQGLVSKFTGDKLSVYGGDDRIEALTDKVKQDTSITIGSLKIRCLFTPCHTTGHICFFVEAPNGDKCVFTGEFWLFRVYEIGICTIY